jgi:pimeloyl-ACP methyl ester carboxylesterase
VTQSPAATRTVAGADLEVETIGSGPPLVLLHGEDGTMFARPFVDELATRYTVTIPSHPGWGDSPRTDQFRSLDDISYLYLALLAEFDGPVPLVGASLGGWLAMEIATKSTQQISQLVLLAPVGIRTGEPTTRYYLDTYASPAETVQQALYGDPDHRPRLAGWTEDEFRRLARAQEAATYFLWEPYLHNPSLLYRLPMVTVPTLVVTGDRDGLILAEDHVKTLVNAFGGPVQTQVLEGCGHRIEEEAPAALAALIHDFLTGR